MSTNNHTYHAPPARGSALARLSNLIARGWWSVQHYGPTLGGLFLGAQEDLVKEHQQELNFAAAGAEALEARTTGFTAKIAAIFADGIVDRAERAWLKVNLPALRSATATHKAHLQKLAGKTGENNTEGSRGRAQP